MASQNTGLNTPASASTNLFPRIEELAVKAAGIDIVTIDAPETLDGVPNKIPVGIRHGHAPEVVSLASQFEAYRLYPQKRTGTAGVLTLQSFINLVNRHKDDDSAIFAQTAMPSPSLTAVIDYHLRADVDDANVEALARFGKHRIHYEFPLTEEFKVWTKLDGKPMEQVDFAAFLEEHAAELAAPLDGERSEYEPLFKERFATPAELIDLSRNLEIFVASRVKRAERLQTGERVVEFVSEHNNAKGEKVEIPGIFMVSVRAFVDGDPVRIPARLRYRMGAGTIHWFYQLYRADYWMRCQVQEDLRTAGEATGLPTYEGSPEK